MSIPSLSRSPLKRLAVKRLILLLFSFSASNLLVFAVNAKDDTDKQAEMIEYARLGEKIRQNKINVGNIYSVSDKNGRFHIIHADKLLLDCSHCHLSSSYKADYLILSKFKMLPSSNKGRIEKSVCLGCHQTGGMGTPWYTGSTIKDDQNE